MTRRTPSILAAVAAASLSPCAHAQWNGPRTSQFPDVIVSSVGGSYDAAASPVFFGVNNGIGAYAIGSDSCNIGTHPAIWVSNAPGYAQYNTMGAPPNQHPVIGSQIYRLFNGRFEQIGMSWLKHSYCAADSCSTGNSSGAMQGCLNIGGNATGTNGCVVDLGSPYPACAMLGYGRATDTYTSSLNANQTDLGPRSEVNPWSGVYPYPFVLQGNNPITCLNKRLLIRQSDLDPATYPRYDAATNTSGAQYFAENVYIPTDEWPTERANNYSHRRAFFSTTTMNSFTGGCTGPYYPLAFQAGSGNLTRALLPAIEAWKIADPSITLLAVDAPNDGRFCIGAKATDLGNGTWQYEYAVFNMNSDRACRSISIPKSTSVAAQITNLGFHAPEYHSGEPYSAAAWTSNVSSSSIAWSCPDYATSPNANAIRWATLYNFRFVSNKSPKTNAPITLTLFKPAVQPGDASTLTVSGLPVPTDPPCRADFNADGHLDTQDIFDFLNAWFNATPAGDFDADGQLTTQDIFDMLNTWFAGC